MANLSRTTQDHDEIRRWAEERGGKPSHVRRTGSGEDIGILRLDFPGYTGEDTLEPISWEEWFEKFDDRNLALIYQEETAGGARSNFNKIISAETAQGTSKRSSKGTRGGAKKAASRGKSATRKKAAAVKQTAKSAAKRGGKKAAGKKSSRPARAAKRSVSKRSTKKAAKKSTPKKRR
jgi:hypothetical protein